MEVLRGNSSGLIPPPKSSSRPLAGSCKKLPIGGYQKFLTGELLETGMKYLKQRTLRGCSNEGQNN